MATGESTSGVQPVGAWEAVPVTVHSLRAADAWAHENEGYCDPVAESGAVSRLVNTIGGYGDEFAASPSDPGTAYEATSRFLTSKFAACENAKACSARVTVNPGHSGKIGPDSTLTISCKSGPFATEAQAAVMAEACEEHHDSAVGTLGRSANEAVKETKVAERDAQQAVKTHTRAIDAANFALESAEAARKQTIAAALGFSVGKQSQA